MIERLFKVRAAGSSVKVELLGGLTTFLTMAYIIFVNPAMISGATLKMPTGLSTDAAMLATCLAAAAATLLMGFLANYPIAQAPGMGENVFFVLVVAAVAQTGVTNAWQVTLGIVFVSGVIFLFLSVVPFRRAVIDAVSPSLKNGIAVGIGLFIALIGLKNATVIVANPGTYVALNHRIGSPELVIFFIGLVVTAALQAWRVKGSILIGILVAAGAALIWGRTQVTGIVGLPTDHALFKLDIIGALRPAFIPFIVVFLFMDLFDTAGTLIGVGEQGGFIKENRLPRAGRAMISDAVGTVVGAATGTSTVTSYIESAAGVAYGARTGLANVVTGLLFLAALFFAPLAGMIGTYGPITAPALVIVGTMMVRNVMKIDWADATEAIPAFLVIIGIPFTFSIADGLALGFISYPVTKVLAGKWRTVSWMMYVVAAIFVLRYALVTAA